MDSVKQEIWETVVALNRLWTVDGKPDELKNYFHEEMVAIVPTARNRVEGRDACVAGWKAFADSAKINYFNATDPDVRIFGGAFAVVTYYYDMSVDMGGGPVKLEGRDMFSLVKERDKWWVVADQFSPCP